MSSEIGDKAVSLRTDEEWRAILSEEEYRILREKGTERPFSGQYDHTFEPGEYVCRGCGTLLFKSEAKFDSGCGWPAFYEAADKSNVAEHEDFSFDMRRVEVTCAKCGGHLGHVFPDAPQTPSGMRYCINSASVGFVPRPSL